MVQVKIASHYSVSIAPNHSRWNMNILPAAFRFRYLVHCGLGLRALESRRAGARLKGGEIPARADLGATIH